MDGLSLLEREELLEQLSSHAAAAARGSGSMVFVGGEAGAGKTSLVEALRPLLPEGTAFHCGYCDPLSAPRPLAPLLDIAPHLAQEVRDLMAASGDRHELFTAFLDGLVHKHVPRVIVFEDVHWADDATLDLLRFVGRRIAESRSMVLATYRNDEVGAAHPVRRLLGDLARVSGISRLSVPPLSLEAVRSLVGDTGREPEQVHGRTGGNPYFVAEVLAMEGDGLPVRAGDAVLARAARSSPGAVRTLQLCALMKQDVNVGVLGRLTSPGDVDECCASGLLFERQGKLVFRHEIAREAIESSIPAVRRRVLHAELLRAFEEAAPDWVTDSDQESITSGDAAERAGWLSVLSFHAQAADEAPAVLRYAVPAGRLALKLRAYREARTQLMRALPHSQTLPTEDRARLYEDHARLCFLVDDMDGAATSRHAAASLFESIGDVEGQVRNLRELVPLLRQQGHAERATAIQVQVDELVVSLPEGSVELASIYNDRAWPVPGMGAPNKAWVERAARSAEASGNHPALTWSHTMDGYLSLLAGKVPAARRRLEHAVAVAASNGLEDVKVDVLHDAGALLSSHHRHRAAEAFLDAAIAVSSDRDLDCTLNFATAAKARSDLYLGRWEDAATNAISVLERSNASLVPRLRALTTLGLLRVRRGDPEAAPLLDEALELAARVANVPTTVAVRAARAEAALARDDHQAALLEASVDLQTAVDAGTPHDVAQLAYLMWKAGGTPQMPLPTGHPFTLQVTGRPLEAARRWRRLGLPFEAARAHAESDDVANLLEALRIFTGLDAAPYRARTAERLRRLGARGIPRGPRPQTQANAAGLTSREMQVLRLLASGSRNADIARHNHVSHRTVDNQVSSILAKLEAQSRGEAVAKAYEIGIISLAARDEEASRPSSAI